MGRKPESRGVVWKLRKALDEREKTLRKTVDVAEVADRAAITEALLLIDAHRAIVGLYAKAVAAKDEASEFAYKRISDHVAVDVLAEVVAALESAYFPVDADAT